MRRLYEPPAYALTPDPGNCWRAGAQPDPARWPPLDGAARTEALVIGAGLTGLSAAYRLAAEHGRATLVLDRGWPGWGASGRAGGFVCMGGAKLSERAMARRHGLAETRRFVDFQRRAVEEAAALIAAEALEVDRHSEGEWRLAHRPRERAALPAAAAELRETFGIAATVHDRDALAERGIAGPEFLAGLHTPIGFAVDPLKLTLGLADAAERAGVRIHGGSEVVSLTPAPGGGLLARTSSGAEVHAERVLLAVNGYGAERWIDGFDGATLPAFSSVLVTRPLRAEERAAQGWTSADMAYDTRRLLHYFRLMPDGRFLFGMRGGVSAAPRAQAAAAAALRRGFAKLFPAWAEVETPYLWSGLVCLAAALTPYVGPIGATGRIHAAFAYHGNGLAMGLACGRRAADLLAGAALPEPLPAALRGPLRRWPAPFLRRLGLRAAYGFYWMLDERP